MNVTSMYHKRGHWPRLAATWAAQSCQTAPTLPAQLCHQGAHFTLLKGQSQRFPLGKRKFAWMGLLGPAPVIAGASPSRLWDGSMSGRRMEYQQHHCCQYWHLPTLICSLHPLASVPALVGGQHSDCAHGKALTFLPPPWWYALLERALWQLALVEGEFCQQDSCP